MKHATYNTKANSGRRRRMFHVSCFMFHDERRIQEKGFSLIEVVIYSALLAMVLSMAIYFMTNIFDAYKKVFAQREVMSNIQFSLDLISQETKFAKSIYSSTSIFDNDNGQLSIKTNQNPPSGETLTYVDFYLDNGRIYVKREGQPEIPLTSNQATINKLRFTHLNPTDAPEGVQIFIEGQYNTTSVALKDQTIMNFTTSAIIRY